MTKLSRDDFSIEGEYIFLRGENFSRRFVGRFKYGAKTSRGAYVTFLCKHFTREEIEGFEPNGSSLFAIAEDRGFVLSHIKKWLREGALKEWRGKTAAQWGLAA